MSAAQLDRERYAERRSLSLLTLGLVAVGSTIVALLLVGHVDAYWWALALVPFLGAAMWWQRSQGPDE